MAAVVSSSHICYSFLLGEDSSHSSLASVWGPSHGRQFPQTSPTWILPIGYNSSPTASVWVPFMGCSPSGRGCSHVSAPQGHKSWQKSCSSTDFPQNHSLLWVCPCSGVGSCARCRWMSAPPWTSIISTPVTALNMFVLMWPVLPLEVLFIHIFFMEGQVCSVEKKKTQTSRKWWCCGHLTQISPLFLCQGCACRAWGVWFSSTAVWFQDLSRAVWV